MSGEKNHDKSMFKIIGEEKLPLLEYKKKNNGILPLIIDGPVGSGKTHFTQILTNLTIPQTLGLTSPDRSTLSDDQSKIFISQPVFELDWFNIPRSAREQLGNKFTNHRAWFRFDGNNGVISSLKRIIKAMREKKENTIVLRGAFSHAGKYAGKADPRSYIFPTNQNWIIIEGVFSCSLQIRQVLNDNRIYPLVLLVEPSLTDTVKWSEERAKQRGVSQSIQKNLIETVYIPSWRKYVTQITPLVDYKVVPKDYVFTIVNA